VPELQPLPSEAIFDKLAMSAFEGTPLFALRDRAMKAVAVVGIAMEARLSPPFVMRLISALFLLCGLMHAARATRMPRSAHSIA